MDAMIRFENVNDDFIAAITSVAKAANVKATIESEIPSDETREALQNPQSIGRFKSFEDFEKMIECD